MGRDWRTWVPWRARGRRLPGRFSGNQEDDVVAHEQRHAAAGHAEFDQPGGCACRGVSDRVSGIPHTREEDVSSDPIPSLPQAYRL